jgi:uncharacterized protein YbjT (DUF2867 family)
MKTYVVTGATGHTGKPIALGLLEAGHNVRIISRSADKASDLVAQGARLFVGDTSDAALLKSAFEGADAVYAMIPMDMGTSDYTGMQIEHATAIAQALKEAGVTHVVALSSVGAHLSSGAGVVQGLEKMENMFNAIEGLNALYLRASYFMENLLGQVGTVKHMGVMATPVRADLPLAMVATSDIAAAGLKALLNLDFAGKGHVYVLGPREVTYNEVASVFGNAIGKPELTYFTAPKEDARKALTSLGMGSDVVERLLEFVDAMNNGSALADLKGAQTPESKTDIRDFAQTFKEIYELN